MVDTITDFLPRELVDERLEKYVEHWRGTRAMVYFQCVLPGNLEVFCNRAATSALGRAHLGNWSLATLPQWLDHASQAGIRHCCVAGQVLFRRTLDTAFDLNCGMEVVRVVREGDCQASSNFGTNTEQAGAEALLSAWKTPGRASAIVKVVGTRCLFVESNFRFDDDDPFTSHLKSCRPIEEVCELVIPQLVSRKNLEHILIDDQELFDQLSDEPSLYEYYDLFRKVACPDPAIEQSRAACRDALLRYSTLGFASSNGNQSKASWLDATRARLGLTSKKTTHTESRIRGSSLALFIRVEDANDAEHLGKLRGVILDALPNADDLFLRMALLVANCRLGLHVDSTDVDTVVDSDSEGEIWWQSAATALTLAAIRSGSIAKWVARLGERGKTVYERLAGQSADNYVALRGALLQCQRALGSELFPFERFEDHLEHAVDYQQLLASLKDGASIAEDRSSPEGVEAIQSAINKDLAQLRFFQAFLAIVNKLPEARLEAHLATAQQLWGNQARYYNALVWLRIVNERWPDAKRAAAEWIDVHPDDADAWYRSARLSCIHEQWEDGVNKLRRACSLDPEHHAAARELAYCLWHLDRDQEALSVLAELRATDDSVRNEVLMAKIYYFQDRFSEADALLSPLSADECTEEDAWYVTLMACCRVRGWEATQVLFDSARDRLDSGNLASVVSGLSEILVSQGAAAQAAEHFYPLLEFGDGWANALANVAQACLWCGRTEDAFALWERAQSLADCELAYLLHASALLYGDGVLREPQAAFRVAADGLTKLPTSLLLLAAAGESAPYAGADPGPYFRTVVKIVESSPADSRTGTMNMYLGLAKYNLGDVDGAITELDAAIAHRVTSQAYTKLVRVLCAYSKGTKPTSELYLDARRAMEKHTPFDRNVEIIHHLHDIETYGRHGMFSHWESLQATAREVLAAVDGPP